MSESYKRYPAVRMFASELRESDYHFKETEEDKAPNFLLLPSGGKANRVMLGGTILDVEDIGSDNPFWRAEIEDPTGSFTVTASSEYRPDPASSLRDIAENSQEMIPSFVTVVGKTDDYRPDEDEGEVIVTMSKPESFRVVDQQQKTNWMYDTAEQTISRLEEEEGDYIRMAEERYGNRTELLREDINSVLESLE